MAVRLLPKSEIDKRKAEEQRVTIQEGLKVAERVDTLRETLATETAAFEQYRTTSLKDIQKDIHAKEQEKNALETEVLVLERRKKEALIPLEAKWEEVNRAQRVCTDWEAELREKDTVLTTQAEALADRERQVSDSENRADNLKRLASAMFSQAESLVAHAKEESAEMRNKAQAELSLVELQGIEVSKRESGVTMKERKLAEREARMELYEIDLANREHTLRASWRVLENTRNKLKNV